MPLSVHWNRQYADGGWKVTCWEASCDTHRPPPGGGDEHRSVTRAVSSTSAPLGSTMRIDRRHDPGGSASSRSVAATVNVRGEPKRGRRKTVTRMRTPM